VKTKNKFVRSIVKLMTLLLVLLMVDILIITEIWKVKIFNML